jgi:hypothetical protein
MLALCLVGFLVIFLIALATSDNARESVGIVCLAAGLDLINPIPTLDWFYFVFPVAIFLFMVTGSWMTKERAVLVAYALSHVVGAILILIGIALLGDSGKTTASNYFNYMLTSPLFIAVMIISIILIIAILYYDFKLKKKHKAHKVM